MGRGVCAAAIDMSALQYKLLFRLAWCSPLPPLSPPCTEASVSFDHAHHEAVSFLPFVLSFANIHFFLKKQNC